MLDVREMFRCSMSFFHFRHPTRDTFPFPSTWLIISAHHAPPGTATLPPAVLPMIVGSSGPRLRRLPRNRRHRDAPPLPVGGPPPTPTTRPTTTRDYPHASGGPSTSSRPTAIVTSPNPCHSAPTPSCTTSRIPFGTSPGVGRSCAPSFWIFVVGRRPSSMMKTSTTTWRCS